MSVVGGPRRSTIPTDRFSMTNSGSATPFVTNGNVSGMESKSEFSFSFWVKLSQTLTGATDTLIYCGDNSLSENWNIQHLKDNSLGWYLSLRVNQNRMLKIVAPTDNEWHHFVFRVDTTKGTPNIFECYIDNVLQTNQLIPKAGTTLTATYPLYFTANGSVGNNIIMNATAIFDKTLTTTEISTIYNSGCPTDISSLNPVIYVNDFDGATFDGLGWNLDCFGVPNSLLTSLNPNAIIEDSPCP